MEKKKAGDKDKKVTHHRGTEGTEEEKAEEGEERSEMNVEVGEED